MLIFKPRHVSLQLLKKNAVDRIVNYSKFEIAKKLINIWNTFVNVSARLATMCAKGAFGDAFQR